MPALAQGVVSEVIALGASTGFAQGGALEVVWYDRLTDLERPEPRAFLLFQDATMAASGTLQFPEQRGATLGVAYASTSNEGDLLAYCSGRWDADPSSASPTPADVVTQVVRTGSLYNSAEYGYRMAADPATDLRGSDDLRWLHDPHCPFGETAALGSCYAMVYSTAFNRVVVGYHPTSSTDLKWAWRSVAAQDPKVWSAVQTMTLSAARGPSLTAGYSSMWELPDGALRWAYTYTTGSAQDMDILGSTDGGTTWKLVKERVLSEIFGAPVQVMSLRVVCSGDWMRLEVFNTSASPQGICSAYSADRGATWGAVEGNEDGDGLDDSGASADSNGRYQTWDVCPVDDSGTFMRVRTVNTSSTLRYELASRDGTWAQIASTAAVTFSAPDADVVSVLCARGPGRVFVLVFRTDYFGAATGLDYWSASSFIIPLDRLEAGWDSSATTRVDDWARWGGTDWLKYAGAARIHPKNSVLCWAGDRLALLDGGVDRQSGTTTAAWQVPSLRYIGGTSRRPVRLAQNTHTDLLGEFATNTWDTAMGAPTGASASTFTPWGASSAGAPALAWNRARTAVTLTTADRVNWSLSQALAAMTQSFADSGTMHWSTKAQDGTIPSTAYPPGAFVAANLRVPRWGATIRSESLLTAGLTLDLAVHIDGAGKLALYDCSAAVTLYESAAGALAGITQGVWYDFRLSSAHSQNLEISGAATLRAEVAWARAGDYRWSSSGLLTVVGGLPLATAFQSVSFGHHAVPGASSTMHWREWFWNRQSHLTQCNFVAPGSTRGWDCLPYPQHLCQGATILWGGAGGFEGDSYNVPVAYEYGVGQMFGDSPASAWHSTGTGTQQLVLDAVLARGKSTDRFVHSGMAAVYTNSRLLQLDYSDSSAFTDPATFYVDGLRYTVVVSETAEPASVKVTGQSWTDGELAGHYLRAQPGGVANPTSVAVQGNSGQWVHLTGLTQALSAYGITAGNTLYVWGTTHVLPYEDWPTGVRVITAGGTVDGAMPRYLRVTVPNATVQGAPPEGRWFLGRLQAGLTLPISVPMAWDTLGDDEDPIVDMQTMASGVRTVYPAGTPRQVITGTSKGDVNEWRTALRSTVRLLAQYSVTPVVLCTDDLQPHLRALYSRFIGSTENEDEGWTYNRSRSRWEKVGNVKLKFEQEV